MCLAGGAARRVRSRALPCSIGGYAKSCAAWAADGGAFVLFVQIVQRRNYSTSQFQKWNKWNIKGEVE